MFVQTLKKFIHAPWESSSKFAPWSVSVYGLNRVCPSAYAILLRVRTDGAEGDFFFVRGRERTHGSGLGSREPAGCHAAIALALLATVSSHGPSPSHAVTAITTTSQPQPPSARFPVR
jgi:hypothetical protein